LNSLFISSFLIRSFFYSIFLNSLGSVVFVFDSEDSPPNNVSFAAAKYDAPKLEILS
jgi:hypothetical protein